MSNDHQHEEYTILTSTVSNNRGQMSQPHLTFTPPTQVFRSEWQRFPEFHAWLRPIDGDITKAWCIACERIFRADLKSLRVHGVSKAHVRMVRARCPNADDNPVPPIEYNVVTDKKGTYGIAVVTNKEDKSSLASRALYMNQTNPTEEIITSEMAAQSQRDKYVVVSLPNEDDDDNEGPQASSSNTQYIQKEVNVIDETGNLVSVVTEHHVQKNKAVLVIKIKLIKFPRKQNIQVESEIKKSPENVDVQKQSGDEDDIAIEEVLTPLRMKQESATNRANMMKRKRGLQKYRTDWEKLSEFRGWLSPEPKSCYKARCEACDKSLVADITVLRNHSQAKKHVMRTGGSIFDGPVRNRSKAKSDDDDEDSPDELQMKSLSIKDNDDDYEVGLQSNDYHSSSNYEKMDQKHEDIPCKAIVSKSAPFWKATAVVNGHVTELKLSDYSGRYLVLFFYPQDFSRICPSELIALSDRVSEFRALNTEVVACSVDSYLSHQAWSRTLRSDGGIAIPKMPLLSDPTHAISKSYGCYLPELGHSLRAHYIIDMRGVLRHVTINDLPVGRNIGEILRLLEAFQYTDETETLCPADWKPGEPTIS